MKRLFILGCFCLAFHLRGQEASSTNAAALPRPVYRFLFLIDTSSAMSRQKTVTLDTVSRLILSGIGGRIQTGDAWNLWMINDQLHTNAIPAQTWDPRQRAELANRIFRFLRAQRFKKKKALLEKSLAAVAEEAKLSGALTVFLFTDGSVPVKGTPFDEPINEIFTKHAAGMRKSKKPFVTVFVAQEGRFSAHAVSPGGERIYIPRLPEAVATAKKNRSDSEGERGHCSTGAGQDAHGGGNLRGAASISETAIQHGRIDAGSVDHSRRRLQSGRCGHVQQGRRGNACANSHRVRTRVGCKRFSRPDRGSYRGSTCASAGFAGQN